VPLWLGCRAPQDHIDHGSWCIGRYGAASLDSCSRVVNVDSLQIELSFISTERLGFNPHGSPSLVDLTISFAIEHLAILSKTNSLHCNMYSKLRNNKEFKCHSSNLPHPYLTSGHLLELRYVSYHLSLSAPSFCCSIIDEGFPYTVVWSIIAERARRHTERY
jgi:hypothetical protein